MLDLISRGAQGHGRTHLLLISAAELGFAWDGAERGYDDWACAALAVPCFCQSEWKGFLGGEFSDFQGSLQLLTSSHLRERD